ncbi:MAG TPA: amidohydrolase family protein, partial [Candidatus Polarisedimenticolia bacterium]|nr:amidohydrolase family protein [Candidatus Polarisedimenticolia bacterium]
PWDQPMAQEFPLLTKLGMTPIDAIRSATSRAAEMLNSKGDLGVVAAGAYADLIAVAGDPLKEIKELGKVRFVMKNGEIFKNELSR